MNWEEQENSWLTMDIKKWQMNWLLVLINKKFFWFIILWLIGNRAYFRCTRKHDQGCRAIKQVQQIQDNPKLYQTTYIGHHTCKNILKAPQMIISDYEHPWNSANNYNVVAGSHDHLNISPDNSKSAAKEDQIVKEEAPSDHDQDNASFDTTRDENSDSLWPNEFKDLELSDPSIGLLSLTKNVAASDNDHDDVVSVMFSFQVDQRTSYTSDDHDLEMDDFVVNSTNFRDIPFDEIEFSVWNWCGDCYWRSSTC